MHGLDGSNWLVTGLELSHIVLYYSFNLRDEMESSSKGRDVLDFGGSAGHEMVPVSNCDLGIPKSMEGVHLFWVLASLRDDLIQDHSLLEGLVGSSPLVGELSTRVSGVEGKVLTGGR